MIKLIKNILDFCVAMHLHQSAPDSKLFKSVCAKLADGNAFVLRQNYGKSIHEDSIYGHAICIKGHPFSKTTGPC